MELRQPGWEQVLCGCCQRCHGSKFFGLRIPSFGGRTFGTKVSPTGTNYHDKGQGRDVIYCRDDQITTLMIFPGTIMTFRGAFPWVHFWIVARSEEHTSELQSRENL